MIEFIENDDYDRSPPSSYLTKRKQFAGNKHIPNKNEAKLLRRLMSETGLTEAQLREHKTYRKQLSDAQKVKILTHQEKIAKRKARILKRITRELGLAKEHPLVLARVRARVREIEGEQRWLRYWP